MWEYSLFQNGIFKINYLFIYLYWGRHVLKLPLHTWLCRNQIGNPPNTGFIGLGYHQSKDIMVLGFILEYSSLRDFYRPPR